MMNQEQSFTNPETAYSGAGARAVGENAEAQPRQAPATEGAMAGDRRPINTDPREQPQWQPMPMPGMARPPQQTNRSLRWVGVSVIILVVIFGGLLSASLLLTHDITTTKAFTVGDAPKLVLTAHSSDIHIVRGPTNQITVVTRQQTFVGDNNQVPVHYDLNTDTNTLTITTDEQNSVTIGFGINRGIDFEVTVPQQTALSVQTSSGDITAIGIEAPMSLTTSSGDITTDGGSGQVTLTATSGDIKASNLSGLMTLSTRSGDVTAINANATGSSSFQTSSGDVTFQGTLADGGSYTFHTGSGDIDMTLPGTAAFEFQAFTQSGDITSDFDEITIHPNSSQASALGTVGQKPANANYAQITAQTSSGDIRLQRY